MKFEKEVMYLGMKTNQLKDGTPFYTVSLFVIADQMAVETNVMGTATELLSRLAAFKCGQTIKATFVLRPKEKLYRLALLSV